MFFCVIPVFPSLPIPFEQLLSACFSVLALPQPLPYDFLCFLPSRLWNPADRGGRGGKRSADAAPAFPLRAFISPPIPTSVSVGLGQPATQPKAQGACFVLLHP